MSVGGLPVPAPTPLLPPRATPLLFLAALLSVSFWAEPARAGDVFRVTPAVVSLEGNFARAQLLVTAGKANASLPERSTDWTHQAAYRSSDPKVATVTSTGQLLAVGNGTATITVTAAGVERPIPV